ncbi:MAG: hypothetical protein HYW70_01580 [Candidatus Nealsonbacteria bacterium]|nr:hypothetical protein [Candidatus Nealsonbacteria bacterium]
MNKISNLFLLLKKPKLIIVVGRGRETAAEAIFQVLKKYFNVAKIQNREPGIREILNNEILISEKIFSWSHPFVLVATHVGEYHPEKEFFAGEEEEVKETKELLKNLRPNSFLVVNYDDETVRELEDLINVSSLNFGLGARAKVGASDITIAKNLNFKINYEGKIVPVWLSNTFGREQIYASLAAASLGIIFGINLVEVSEALALYKSLPGRMQLISGIKNSLVLDDSAASSVFSMVEALDILRKMEAVPDGKQGRKIAVLGDVVGVGKYAIEAHEAIGEKVRSSADLLFAVGAKARFIAEGAEAKGMAKENIFQFDLAKEAAKVIQEKVQEGDIILVDGSKEMQMSEVVGGIRLEK